CERCSSDDVFLCVLAPLRDIMAARQDAKAQRNRCKRWSRNGEYNRPCRAPVQDGRRYGLITPTKEWSTVKRLLPHVLCGLLLSGLALWGTVLVRAEDDPAKERTNVSLDQQRVQIRFKELQDKLLKLAEITEATDPNRAALLRKAFEQGSKQQIEQ